MIDYTNLPAPDNKAKQARSRLRASRSYGILKNLTGLRGGKKFDDWLLEVETGRLALSVESSGPLRRIRTKAVIFSTEEIDKAEPVL